MSSSATLIRLISPVLERASSKHYGFQEKMTNGVLHLAVIETNEQIFAQKCIRQEKTSITEQGAHSSAKNNGKSFVGFSIRNTQLARLSKLVLPDQLASLDIIHIREIVTRATTTTELGGTFSQRNATSLKGHVRRRRASHHTRPTTFQNSPE